MQVAHQHILQILLLSGARSGFTKFRENQFFELTEIRATGFDVAAETGVVTGVAVGNELIHFSIRANAMRDLERQGIRIHAADVSVKKIFRIDRGATELGVKIK